MEGWEPGRRESSESLLFTSTVYGEKLEAVREYPYGVITDTVPGSQASGSGPSLAARWASCDPSDLDSSSAKIPILTSFVHFCYLPSAFRMT